MKPCLSLNWTATRVTPTPFGLEANFGITQRKIFPYLTHHWRWILKPRSQMPSSSDFRMKKRSRKVWGCVQTENTAILKAHCSTALTKAKWLIMIHSLNMVHVYVSLNVWTWMHKTFLSYRWSSRHKDGKNQQEENKVVGGGGSRITRPSTRRGRL